MKQRIRTGLKAILFLLVVVWILDKIPFHKNINQEVTASLYENGQAVEQATVMMEGEKSRYLFREDESYWGKFQVPYYEMSMRENVHAGIGWSGEDHIQNIHYMMPGHILDADIMYFMLISDDMTQFVLTFRDGRVLATSAELYELYTKHFIIRDASGTSIVEVEKIPKI